MKKIASLFLIPFACLAISCDKEGEGGATSGPAVLGVSVTDVPSIVEVPENQTKTFELKVTANPGPASAISVTVGTDETLVDKYNTANGTSYEMLPEAAYEISATPLTLMKYNKTSVPGTLKLKGAGCELDKVYVLPLVVETVKGDAAYETPEDKVAYVLYKMLESQIMGAGTQTDPYVILDLKTFNAIGDVLKDGETVYIKLGTDIDFAEGAWTPIDATGTPISLDGDNHKIKNVKATSALFSVLEGTVENLGFDAVTVEAGAERAGILADAAGTEDADAIVKKVTITNSTITNTGYTGGLFGSLVRGTVEDVNVAATVTGNDRTAGLIGHLVSGTLTRCVTSGDVTAGEYYSGGLVGMMAAGTVTECSASGNIISNAPKYPRAGGLIGQMFGGSVIKSHATGNVTGKGHYAGGLIGVIQAVIKENDVVVETKDVLISKCYATGNVTLPAGPSPNNKSGAGGLIGITDSGNITVSDCYATGAVTAYRWSSGFIGNIYNSTVTIKNGYTSSDLSGMYNPAASGVVVGNASAADATKNLPAGSATCTGFVAWYDATVPYCYPAEIVPLSGNYSGKEGKITSQASKFSWDSAIWNLTGDAPTLK